MVLTVQPACKAKQGHKEKLDRKVKKGIPEQLELKDLREFKVKRAKPGIPEQLDLKARLDHRVFKVRLDLRAYKEKLVQSAPKEKPGIPELQEQLALLEKLDLKEYKAKSVQKDHKVRSDRKE